MLGLNKGESDGDHPKLAVLQQGRYHPVLWAAAECLPSSGALPGPGAQRGRELAWREGEAAPVFGLAGNANSRDWKLRVSSELGYSLCVLEEVTLQLFWNSLFVHTSENTAQLICLEKTSGRSHCRGPVPKGSYKNDEERLFLRACTDRTRENGFNMKEGRFRLDVRRNSLLQEVL